MASGGFQKDLAPQDVGGKEGLRIQDAAVHMAFRRKVNHRVKIVFPEKPLHQGAVPDVPLYEAVTGVLPGRSQVFRVPRIGEQIQIHQKKEAVFPPQRLPDKI